MEIKNTKICETPAKDKTPHTQAIIQTAKSGITNARVEAVNNSIKLIVKTAYGFRNFNNLQSMVMLKLSGLNVELPGREKVTSQLS